MMTPTPEQIIELRDAIIGTSAMLLPRMPDWYLALSDDDKAAAVAIATGVKTAGS